MARAIPVSLRVSDDSDLNRLRNFAGYVALLSLAGLGAALASRPELAGTGSWFLPRTARRLPGGGIDKASRRFYDFRVSYITLIWVYCHASGRFPHDGLSRSKGPAGSRSSL